MRKLRRLRLKEAAIRSVLAINCHLAEKCQFLDVYRDDVARLTVLNKILKFVNNLPKQQGLYLYGDFGVGKSFMVAAGHDLSRKTTAFHLFANYYPSLSLMSKML